MSKSPKKRAAQAAKASQHGKGGRQAIEEDIDALDGEKGFFYSDKWLFGSMATCSAIALFVSFWLSVEAWQIAKDANTSFFCDVNAIFSCGTVARSWQATLVGFPNAFWGILFESVVLCVSVAKLMGSKFSRLFMFFLQGFYTFAIVFALWLFYSSAFVIRAFCLLCLIITVTTVLEWFDLFRVNIRDEGLYFGGPLRAFAEKAVAKSWDMMACFGLLFVLLLILLAKYGPALIA